MRRRLLRSTLAIALLAVVTLGVPLLLLARHEVWSTANDTLRQQAATTAAGLEDRIDVGQPVQLGRYAAATHGRRIVVVAADGRTSTAGPALSGPVLQASVTVSGSTVTVQAERQPTVVRAREVTAFVVGLSLLAVATAVGLALRQSSRLTRPLSQLHDRADALGRGDFRPSVLVSGIPEIDGISAVLERSARQLGTTIELQRDFASDAAHQLRTPLTGIGLRLDELTRIGDAAVRQEAEDALAQVERLDRVISVLLARARGDAAAPTEFDVSEVLSNEVDGWSRTLAEQDRSLSLLVEPGHVVQARREHVASIVSCLLDNALRHGVGAVTLSCHGDGAFVDVAVSDEGPGVPPELAEQVFERRVSGGDGTGIGLALARSLAAAEGGELALADRSRFLLTLPEVATRREV
ncbi:MAG: histidine kinase [Frankiales bacterium]|nr:histidine kinase [Frankiales bacterium]